MPRSCRCAFAVLLVLLNRNICLKFGPVPFPALGNKSTAGMSFVQVPETREDILTILGDTKDPKFPIWRSGSDSIYTLCTAFFDLQKETVEIIFTNPKLGLVSGSAEFPLRSKNNMMESVY